MVIQEEKKIKAAAKPEERAHRKRRQLLASGRYKYMHLPKHSHKFLPHVLKKERLAELARHHLSKATGIVGSGELISYCGVEYT
jgi:hypothetical protein